MSSRENPPGRRPGYWYESWALYFRKTHGRGYALMAASLWLFGAAINKVFVSTGRSWRSVPPNFYSDFWTYGIRPLLGLETRVSHHDELRPTSQAGEKGMSR